MLDFAKHHSLNTYTQDEFLNNPNFLKDNDLPKFDVVIGNPPYNKQKQGGGMGSGNSIWEKFVMKGYNILNPGGHFGFIHPVQWRGQCSKIRLKVKNILFDNQLIWLKMGYNPFDDVNVLVDSYVGIKKEVVEPTNIEYVDNYSNVTDIGNFDMDISAFGNPNFKNICSKVFNNHKNPNFYGRKSWGALKIFDKNSLKGKYEFIHGANYTKKVFRIEEYKHIHHNKFKVYTTSNNSTNAQFDPGTKGISDHVHYEIVTSEKEGNSLVTLWNSKLVKVLIDKFEFHTVSYSIFPLTHIKSIPKEMNDDEIYQYFKLTEKEIKYIENECK